MQAVYLSSLLVATWSKGSVNMIIVKQNLLCVSHVGNSKFIIYIYLFIYLSIYCPSHPLCCS
ncbi:hypothetical protein HanRHA438_Chr01g0041531 [Helianthus annuus]|nr:hypothetical protein HanRHA438_Chr01g0041531 [Helianthus annuus]